MAVFLNTPSTVIMIGFVRAARCEPAYVFAREKHPCPSDAPARGMGLRRMDHPHMTNVRFFSVRINHLSVSTAGAVISIRLPSGSGTQLS